MQLFIGQFPLKKSFSICFLHISNWVFIENTLNAHYLKWNVNCTLNLLTDSFSYSLSLSQILYFKFVYVIINFFLRCIFAVLLKLLTGCVCTDHFSSIQTHSLRYYAWHFLLCTTDGKWTHCNTFALCSLSSLYFFFEKRSFHLFCSLSSFFFPILLTHISFSSGKQLNALIRVLFNDQKSIKIERKKERIWYSHTPAMLTQKIELLQQSPNNAFERTQYDKCVEWT